jgi:hypothetical protein
MSVISVPSRFQTNERRTSLPGKGVRRRLVRVPALDRRQRRRHRGHRPTADQVPNVIKQFTNFRNKLECLSLASLRA